MILKRKKIEKWEMDAFNPILLKTDSPLFFFALPIDEPFKEVNKQWRSNSLFKEISSNLNNVKYVETRLNTLILELSPAIHARCFSNVTLKTKRFVIENIFRHLSIVKFETFRKILFVFLMVNVKLQREQDKFVLHVVWRNVLWVECKWRRFVVLHAKHIQRRKETPYLRSW